jgi:hypothetical protein
VVGEIPPTWLAIGWRTGDVFRIKPLRTVVNSLQKTGRARVARRYVVDPIRIELSHKDAYVPDQQTITVAERCHDTQGDTLGTISTSDVQEFLRGLLRIELRHQIAALRLIIAHSRGSAWTAAQMYVSTLVSDE